MPKRPQAGSAAAGSNPDAKRAKPHVHVCTLTIMMPHNTEPESPKLDAKNESKRAAQKANENATSEETYGKGDYDKFAKRFEAAVASACAKWRRPVTLNEVIIAMTDMTGKVKINKKWRERFVRDGFRADRWQIYRSIPGKGLVALEKVPFFNHPGHWRFSPSPAARCPLAELPCEPSPRSSAGCVVC